MAVYAMGGVKFQVQVEGQPVAVRISDEALQDHFGADGGGAQGLVAAYEANSATIDAKAIAKVKANPGREVLLRTADF